MRKKVRLTSRIQFIPEENLVITKGIEIGVGMEVELAHEIVRLQQKLKEKNK